MLDINIYKIYLQNINIYKNQNTDIHTHTYMEVVRMILTYNFPVSTTGIASLAPNSLAVSR